MPGHRNQAIMNMINGSQQLQDKWNQLILKMESNLKDEFYNAMGVPIPSAVTAQVMHMDSAAEFSTKANVQEFTNGIAGILGSIFEQNWPAVALDATNFVGSIIEKIIGSGQILTGFQGDAHKIQGASATDPTTQVTWVVACFAVTEQCQASDWGSDETFYGSSFVFTLWNPTEHEVSLLTI
jgi:hypothetical protein